MSGQYTINYGKQIKNADKEYSVKELYTMYKAGTLKPIKQQREPNVWTRPKKEAFIHSLVSGYLIPQLYFIEDEKQENLYYILDGLQRISTITSFFDNQFSVYFEEIGKKVFFKDIINKDILVNRRLKVSIPIDPVAPEAIIVQYLRLQNGTNHNANEIRYAIGGKMAEYIKDMAETEYFTNISACSHNRMNDQKACSQIVCVEDSLSSNNEKIALCDSKCLFNLYVKYQNELPSQQIFDTINKVIGYMQKVFKDSNIRMPASYTVAQYLMIRNHMDIIDNMKPDEYLEHYMKNIINNKEAAERLSILTKSGWNHKAERLQEMINIMEKAVIGKQSFWNRITSK